MKDNKHILVVDREPDWRQFVGRILGKEGFTVHVCSDAPSALQQIEDNNFDLVIIDASLVREIQTLTEEAIRHRLLVVSSVQSVPEAINAYRWGALDYVNKAFGEVSLLTTVTEVLKR